MDIFTALRSRKGKYDSWKNIYVDIVEKMELRGPKPDVNSSDRTDWYDHCMNVMVKKKILPILKKRNGINLNYTFQKISEKFVEEHIDNYIRVIVMITLYNLTCDQSQKLYVSNYDHDTDIVVAYPIEELLMAAFYGIEIRGILFIGNLNKIVTTKGYKKPVTDEDAVAKMFVNINYSNLFNMPYDGEINAYKEMTRTLEHKAGIYRHLDGYNRYYDRSAEIDKKVAAAFASEDEDEDEDADENENEDENEDADEKDKANKAKKTNKPKKVNDLKYHPCCSYMIDITGHIVEKCSQHITEGAHACFGDCGTDYEKKEKKNIQIHSQMFDFNKFIIKIEKLDDDGCYHIEFDENQNQPYKHASYTDMGRGKVITSVSEKVSKCSYVTGMDIKIIEKENCYEANVKYIGINWF